MSITSVLSSSGRDIFDLAYRISPIILTGGLAKSTYTNALPIVALTEGLSFANSLLTSGSVNNLDNFFAHFDIPAGGTLINNMIGQYPFANQSVAANAIIQNPLNLSVVMHCPMSGRGAAVTKMSTIMALQASLDLHNQMGGTYTIITPAYLYTNMVMNMMRDISQAGPTQPQSMFQFDFTRPLTQISQLQQVKSTLMAKLANGTKTGTSWGATGSGNPFTSLIGNLVS